MVRGLQEGFRGQPLAAECAKRNALSVMREAGSEMREAKTSVADRLALSAYLSALSAGGWAYR
jgi:hypothetical protein